MIRPGLDWVSQPEPLSARQVQLLVRRAATDAQLIFPRLSLSVAAMTPPNDAENPGWWQSPQIRAP